MRAHQDLILLKMNEEVYASVSFEFAFSLINESERGAILIGSSKVEEYLEKLLMVVLPLGSKSYTSRLFNYPGTLSSFSGKIEMSYAFRLFDDQLYNSLNELRKIRNNAAHSSLPFSLKKSAALIDKIYSFEDNFPKLIHDLSWAKLIQWKLRIIQQSFDKSELNGLKAEEEFNKLFPVPEEDERLAEQLILWKLSHGLHFLCLKLECITEEYQRLITNGSIWLDLFAVPPIEND
ncbi:hypothetical protein FBD94_06850 [Pedobacter hiemivivus]|uniref:DUF4145 domain-containing protein n=1 Tax=Pedobacter hiemivivus TaxID=2530454 RepID=A0A4U1GLZ6_9SPHI|nr:hypothetical protein [Pedobacter hiemivivus]TKC64053.1 hypothetical protein FBD94_06850 [Pedobacter hiemivivus]